MLYKRIFLFAIVCGIMLGLSHLCVYGEEEQAEELNQARIQQPGINCLPATLCFPSLYTFPPPLSCPWLKGLSLKIQVPYIKIYGADEKSGVKILYRETTTVQGLDYGYSHDSVKLEPASRLLPSLEFSVKGLEKDTLSLGVWGVKTEDSQKGRFEAPAPTGLTTYANYFYMWGNDFSAYDNTHPSGYSPIDYYSKISFNHMVINANFIIPIHRPAKHDLAKTDLSWSLGIKAGYFKHQLKQNLRLRYFIYNYYSGVDYENRVSLDVRSSARITFFGPSVALHLEAKPLPWLNLEGRLAQSCLLGEARLKGKFVDIDDMTYFINGTNTITGTDYWCGTMPFKDTTSVVIPVSELEINLVFPIQEWLKLRMGGLISTWHSLPLAPNFGYVGEAWQTRKETVTFGALATLFAVELEF